MGCGATKEVVQQARSEFASLSCHIALQSTGGLQLVLQQSVLRKAFKKFVQLQWVPSASTGTDFIIQQSRETATNCLDFWTDTRDFCKIKRSTFRTYRAVFLFEKYLMHGAAKQVRAITTRRELLPEFHVDLVLAQVPVSINVLDDCVAALFSAAAATEIDTDIFAAAESEVML
jgi:hypothetical protein